MRNTLDLDEDATAVIMELAHTHNFSIGKEVSRLVREALQARPGGHGESVAGFEPFPAEGRLVTNEIIDRLRDLEGV